MKKAYFLLYLFFNTSVIIFIRIALFFLLVCFLYFFTAFPPNLQKVFFLYAVLFIMNEWFILARVNRLLPIKTVHDAGDEREESVFFATRKKLFDAKDVVIFIHSLSHNSIIQKFLGKISSTPYTPVENVSKEQILQEAAGLVTSAHGLYITGLDLLASYILLTENKAKFLENNGLNRVDFENWYFWVRSKMKIDEGFAPQILFSGYGVFDFFVYGWNVNCKSMQ